MTRTHVFDAHLETATKWLDEIAGRLALPPDERPRSLHALRAGLHAIRDRLPAAEVIALGAQLPALIRGFYYEGWTLANDPTRMRERVDLIARVKKELMLDPRLDAVEVLRAVIQQLAEHISPGEIRHVVSTLPRPIAELWQDVTGPVAVAGRPAP